MEENVRKAIAAIEAQQEKVTERSAVWMVGEQLKDICRAEPGNAALICQDLQVKELSISAAEKKIKAYADANRTGNFACVTPAEAEKILREFYGLADAETAREEEPKGPGGIVSIFDLM